MTSIVVSTGVGSPRRCLDALFDRARARGCTSGSNHFRADKLRRANRPTRPMAPPGGVRQRR